MTEGSCLTRDILAAIDQHRDISYVELIGVLELVKSFYLAKLNLAEAEEGE
jgi:hypothetical protein